MSKMKKVLFVLTIFTALLFFSAPSLLGFSLLHLGDAVKVATNMGAKLACSARYISGFKPELIQQDLASYSPANQLLELEYVPGEQTVQASLLGMAEAKAQFYPQLGCSLVMAGGPELASLQLMEDQPKPVLWPMGEQVDTVAEYQQIADRLLTEDNQQGLQTRAIVVIKDGKLVAETYADGIGQKTPLLGWSMAKSVTAMLIGRLQYLQGINMQQDALFTQWQGDERKRIQLQHLLTMSSGLDFDETYAPGSDATRMLFLSASASDVALTSELADKPGSLFYYSSGTTNILTRWLHETLGGSQATLDFLQRELLQPLAMTNTWFETDSSGVLVGSSYMYASARDWARLGNLMLAQGQVGEQRLLSEQWIKQAVAPNPSVNDGRYGYQFWLNAGADELRWPELPEDTYAMLGNRQQAVVVIPSKNTVVVRLGWTQGHYPLGKNVSQFIQL